MTTIIDLKRLRESVRPEVTQAELGLRLGKDQAQISRWESDPGAVPIGVVQDICHALGVDVAAALAATSRPEFAGLDVGDPYADHRAAHLRLSTRLDEGTSTSPEVLDSLPAPLPDRARVLEGLAPLVRKPLLGVFGAFDAGKSTLLNSMLGQEVLPTGYAPLTRIPLYVRHVDDRPAWMREDQTWLFAEGWDPSLWRSEEHCSEYRIVAGGKSTLEEHASHRGTRSGDSKAVAAAVFIDAPLLRACDLLDSPGYDNQAIDDALAVDGITRVDVAVYCSPYIGFMNASDILRAGRLIRTLPDLGLDSGRPLSNLFFVATHVQPTEPTGEELQEILDAATQRCWRMWGGTLLEELAEQDREQFEPEAVRDRFFTFSKQSEAPSAPLMGALSELLGQSIPTMRKRLVDTVVAELRTSIDETAGEVIEQFEALRTDRQEAEAELEWLLDHEGERQARVKAAREAFHGFVKRSRRKTLADFSAKAETIVTSDHVRKVVDSFHGKKKEAQKGTLAVLVEELQSAAGRICTRESEAVKGEMAVYLDVYRSHVTRPGSVSAPFNVEGAFLGGLAGLAGVGALAVWASTLGNLGAYILAAKFASVLAALGISFSGGAATVVSALAMVGGPVTIAIAIVALAAIAGLAIFGSWEGRLTKAVLSALKRKKVVSKISDQIGGYWDDTAKAFDKGADEVEKEFLSHLDELTHRARDITDDEIGTVIENTTMARYWYGSLPW